MSVLGQDEQIREYQFRFKYLYFALFIAFSTLLARLWHLQILNGEKFRQYSENNRIRPLKIRSPRGMIFDRNKTLLVDNRPAFDAEIVKQYFFANKDWPSVLRQLSLILSIPEKEILKILDKSHEPAFRPIKIKRDLSREEVAYIESRKIDLPGVSIETDILRTNLYNELAAHLLGYIGEVSSTEIDRLNTKAQVPYRNGDYVGKSGLEAKWEYTLRGIDGEEYIEVDALGRRIHRADKSLVGELPPKEASPGNNVVLTIDQDLQVEAQKAFGDKVGAVVALNPRTGEVLAAVSQPSFDPSKFSRGIPGDLWKQLLHNENRPLRDKTLQDHYSPGSTFKPITALAALEEGVIDENTTIHCPGSIWVGNRKYHCHKASGHGTVNVVDALTQSCDVFFYRVSQKLGIDSISKYAKMLGLGKKTGINLSHEEPGLIPTEEWKRKRFGVEWIAGETLSCAIGQSYVLATVLQMANAYAAIATGGLFFKPYVVKYIESPDGRILEELRPEALGEVKISPKNLAIVKRGLHAVVNSPHGTAYAHRLPGFEVAGKTGTSQVFRISADRIYADCSHMEYKYRHHGLFVAFAPMDDPKIAVAVIAEHACHGSSGASPIAFAIIKKYLQKINPTRFNPDALAKNAKSSGTAALPGKPKATEDDEDVSATTDESTTAPILNHPMSTVIEPLIPKPRTEGEE